METLTKEEKVFVPEDYLDKNKIFKMSYEERLQISDILEAKCNEIKLEDLPVKVRNYFKFMSNLWFIQKITNLLNAGYSPLITIVGKTNKGKSKTALLIALYFKFYVANLSFSVKDHTFHSISDFVAKMADESLNFSIVIIEEAGNSLGSDNWNSSENSFFSKIQQTQRIRNNLYILCLPGIRFLSSRHWFFMEFLLEKVSKKYLSISKIETRPGSMKGDMVYKQHWEDIDSVIMPPVEFSILYDLLEAGKKRDIVLDMNEKIVSKINQKKARLEKSASMDIIAKRLEDAYQKAFNG